MNALRPLLTTTQQLRPVWRWLAWCLLAWLSARVIADGADLAWRLGHSPAPAVASFQMPADALPVTGADLWANSTPEHASTLPLTRLPLSITGVARSSPLESSVIILTTSQGQKVVTLDEQIDEQVRLVDITPQGLVLDNQGRQESLPWPQPASADTGYVRAAPAQPRDNRAETTTLPVAWPEDAFSSRFGSDYRQRLLSEPAPLLRYFQAAPVIEEQQLKGYRLRPGSDASLFDALPLESGDVITAVEGRPVRESEALDLLRTRLRDAHSLRIQLQRNGRPITLEVEFSS